MKKQIFSKLIVLLTAGLSGVACQKVSFAPIELNADNPGLSLPDPDDIPVTTTLPQIPTTTTTLPEVPPTTTTVPTPALRPVRNNFVVTENERPSDILFIVHNSPSMFGYLRNDLPYRFNNMLDSLAATNYRVAVTSDKTRGIQEYESGNITRILRNPVPGTGIAITPLTYYLSGNTQRESANLVATLMRPEAICIQVGTHLCPHGSYGQPEPLQVSRQFLQRNPRQFIREGSNVHIISISSLDEVHGTSDPVVRRRPQDLVQEFATRYPRNTLKFHSIIRLPGGRCSSHTDFRSGDILASASRLTGGSIIDICDDFDRTSIRNLAQSIKPSIERLDQHQLECDPVDRDQDGKPDIQVKNIADGNLLPYIYNNRILKIQPQVPKNTRVQIDYFCR